MLTPIEVEQRARELLEQAKRRELGEDSLVEMKQDWPKPEALAPRLAALANSARGDTVFLIIGVDRDGAVKGATAMELANWLPQLEKRFDEVAPRPGPDVRLCFDEKIVHVLSFDPVAPPYVCRPESPNEGDKRLVLMRRGTGTRPAGRADLVEMLVMQRRRPIVDLLGVSLDPWTKFRVGSAVIPAVTVGINLYLASPDLEPIFLPKHLMMGSIAFDDGKEAELMFGSFVSPNSALAEATEAPASIDGAGLIVARFLFPCADEPMVRDAARVRFGFSTAFGHAYSAAIELKPIPVEMRRQSLDLPIAKTPPRGRLRL